MNTQRKYIPDLLIMTKDTDPDLRFMALNDLEKEISNPAVNVNHNQLITYSQILVRCLDDEFSEVRTQSLKCFESIAFRLRQDILPLIKELVKKKPKKISITSTIYTMALHNILKNLPPIEQLYTSIIDIILPEILSDKKLFFTEIDYIELLNDVAIYLGNFLTSSQVLNALFFLTDSSFNADAIISKKSIMACNLFIKNIDDSAAVSLFMNNLLDTFQKCKNPIDGKVTLLSIFAASISGNPNLMYKHIPMIWDFVSQVLQLTDIDKIDDDYESQQKVNMVKLEALVVLNKLFTYCQGENVEVLTLDVLNICQAFMSYDPYHNNESDDESLDEGDDNFGNADEDDDEYSDYEQDDDDDENDDCSWKLRAASLMLITTIVQHSPIKLPLVFKYNFNSLIGRLLVEKNKDVLIKLVESLTFIFESCSSDGVYYSLLSSKAMAETTSGRRYSDVSMQTDDDPYAILVGQHEQICNCLGEFIGAFHSILGEKVGLLLKLLAKLTTALCGLEPKYSQMYIIYLSKLWKGQLFIPETYLFFSSIISNDSIESLGDGFPYFVEYLKYCLTNDTNYRLLTDSLNLMNRVFASNISESSSFALLLGNTFIGILTEKIYNKNLSTEIRLQSLNGIVLLSSKLVMNVDQSRQILNIFVEIISTEVLALNCLNSIVTVIKAGKILEAVTAGWVKTILNYVLEYLNLSDLNSASLKVIKEFSQYHLLDQEDGKSILESLDKLHSAKKFNSIISVDIGIIIVQLLKLVNISNQLPPIISMIIDLAIYDSFDDVLPALMTELLKQSSEENLSKIIQQFGKATDLKISKLLAVLTVISRDEHSIGTILSNLNDDKDIYFSLVFLNQVSKSIDLNVGLKPFLLQFSSEKRNIVNISIKTVSTIVSKYTHKYLNEYLEYLENTAYLEPAFRCLSLILSNTEVDKAKAYDIFSLIIEIEKRLSSNVGENKQYENASICMSKLLLKYDLLASLLIVLSESGSLYDNLAITLGTTPKYTFVESDFLESTSLQLLVRYAELTTKTFIFHSNLVFKETGIFNLNLILNKKPNIAISLMSKMMPNIMETEIKANKAYIHTQHIGPYKHKIDDGLNYRKQIFESIYYLLKTLEDHKNLVFLCNIRWAFYFNKYFDSGIKDDQSVASICLLSTIKIFERDPKIFNDDVGDVNVYDGFITRCRKALNKKIADNAVKQDIEKQNNLVKMIIRFMKKTNILIETNKLVLTANQIATWNAFISETKSKFPIFNSED